MHGGGTKVADAVDAIVLAALPEEMRPLRAMLADLRPFADDGESWRGRWGSREMALVVTGDGARNARAGATAAFFRVRARAVIAIGVAGALSPELAAGDLLVAHQVLPAARPAALISVPRLAASRADKRHLAIVAGQLAPGLAAAVDLESAAFAAAAIAWGRPWLILRAISDEAHEELPALLNDCLDEGGALRRGRLAVGLFRQPSLLPGLLSIRQRVHRCAETLAAAVLAVIARLGEIDQEERQADET